MGFSQGLSGLNSQAKNMGVIGNNVANSQTVGFKGSRTLFSDVYAGGNVGLGTQISAVQQDFSGGNIEASSRSLDLAIAGEGFLRFEQEGAIVYSRNGQLNIDKDGFLTNAQGSFLTGFSAEGGIGSSPVRMKVPAEGLPSVATGGVDTVLNLDARSPIIDRALEPFDINDDATYSFSTNVTAFDSQGNAQNVTKYYTHTGTNQWEVRVGVNGVDSPQVAEMTFTNSGLLDTQTNMDNFTFNVGAGVDPLEIDMEFRGSTQFGSDFLLTGLDQDGNASGQLVGVEIDNEGNVVSSYSNGERQIQGTIALVNFRNKEGLQPVGGNAWKETGESGVPFVGAPKQGILGSIESNAVETSNVDLAGELVKMIIAQRSYQANSQTIKTEDELLQTAINLK